MEPGPQGKYDDSRHQRHYSDESQIDMFEDFAAPRIAGIGFFEPTFFAGLSELVKDDPDPCNDEKDPSNDVWSSQCYTWQGPGFSTPVGVMFPALS